MMLSQRLRCSISPVKQTRRKFISGIASGATVLLTHRKITYAKSGPSRPNVVFILADDLGWGDLSCYGRPDYRTPNLDLLASQGTRFTDAYSASAVCTPTRCGFITGRYPARYKIGLVEPLPVSNHQVGLDPQIPTIASL